MYRRPPRGGRGLKLEHAFKAVCSVNVAPPARGAWIETNPARGPLLFPSSPPARGAWIETESLRHPVQSDWSPPARGAWIETRSPKHRSLRVVVAPRAGGVD